MMVTNTLLLIADYRNRRYCHEPLLNIFIAMALAHIIVLLKLAFIRKELEALVIFLALYN